MNDSRAVISFGRRSGLHIINKEGPTDLTQSDDFKMNHVSAEEALIPLNATMPKDMPHETAAAPTSVNENIQSVTEMETSLEERRTVVDRVADLIGGFSGSMTFVFLHVFWFTAWFLINTGLLPGVKRFDPYPFILLAMIVSVEGVLLSTFVLMKQNRMQKRIDIRDQLDLQINLLTEKEVTKTLQLLRAIADKVGVHPLPNNDKELEEMASTTSVDMLARRVESDLTPKV